MNMLKENENNKNYFLDLKTIEEVKEMASPIFQGVKLFLNNFNQYYNECEKLFLMKKTEQTLVRTKFDLETVNGIKNKLKEFSNERNKLLDLLQEPYNKIHHLTVYPNLTNEEYQEELKSDKYAIMNKTTFMLKQDLYANLVFLDLKIDKILEKLENNEVFSDIDFLIYEKNITIFDLLKGLKASHDYSFDGEQSKEEWDLYHYFVENGLHLNNETAFNIVTQIFDPKYNNLDDEEVYHFEDFSSFYYLKDNNSSDEWIAYLIHGQGSCCLFYKFKNGETFEDYKVKTIEEKLKENFQDLNEEQSLILDKIITNINKNYNAESNKDKHDLVDNIIKLKLTVNKN